MERGNTNAAALSLAAQGAGRLNAQVKLRDRSHSKSIFERGLHLNFSTPGSHAIVAGGLNLIEREVVLNSGDDFSDVADKASVDGEVLRGELAFQQLDPLKNMSQSFLD